MASFDKCFFFVRFPCFFKGTHFSTMQSISLFKIFKHSVAVLFSGVLFQSIFAKYFLLSLYLPLWKFFLYRIFLFCSPFTLMIICIWLWSLHPSGSHILTLSINSYCELNTMSNTFSPLVGSNTCWIRKLSCTKFKNFWSSLPVLCRDFHCIRPWLKSPIIIQSRLLTSFIAFCIFSFSSVFMFGLR